METHSLQSFLDNKKCEFKSLLYGKALTHVGAKVPLDVLEAVRLSEPIRMVQRVSPLYQTHLYLHLKSLREESNIKILKSIC